MSHCVFLPANDDQHRPALVSPFSTSATCSYIAYRITGTSSLIAFIAYSPQLTGLITSAPRWQLVLFNALVALLWHNYAKTVMTDPGGVPAGWSPEVELPEMRYCKKCEVLKPPRAHHCRYCKRCVSVPSLCYGLHSAN